MTKSTGARLRVAAFLLVALTLLACAPAWSQNPVFSQASAPPPPPAPPPPDAWEAEHTPLHYAEPPTPPRYPGFAFLAGHVGDALLVITVGATGTVIDAYVSKSSGYRELDTAALHAVRHWQFNKLASDLPSYTRPAKVPFHFALPPAARHVVLIPRQQGEDGPASKPALQWPHGYAHPRYIAAEGAAVHQSVAEAIEALEHGSEPVFGAHGTLTEFVHADAQGQPDIIWFVLDRGTPNAMAVRYAFAGTAGAPLVEVSVVCGADAATCSDRTRALLQGPFFATAAPTAP